MKREKIVKTKPGWHRETEVKRLKIVMTVILVILVVSILAAGALCWQYLFPEQPAGDTSSVVSQVIEPQTEEEQDDLNLILVNNNSPLPETVSIDLCEFAGVSINKIVESPLKQMLEAAEKDGCNLQVVSAYVSREKQEELYQQKVQELISQGQSKLSAQEKAKSLVAQGGCSEYQTGLLLDFAGEENSAEYRWLSENAVTYGFVLRYPQNKEDITGQAYQAMTYRYVGPENAKKMRTLQMCLEEYVSYLSNQP